MFFFLFRNGIVGRYCSGKTGLRFSCNIKEVPYLPCRSSKASLSRFILEGGVPKKWRLFLLALCRRHRSDKRTDFTSRNFRTKTGYPSLNGRRALLASQRGDFGAPSESFFCGRRAHMLALTPPLPHLWRHWQLKPTHWLRTCVILLSDWKTWRQMQSLLKDFVAQTWWESINKAIHVHGKRQNVL